MLTVHYVTMIANTSYMYAHSIALSYLVIVGLSGYDTVIWTAAMYVLEPFMAGAVVARP